MAGTMGLIQDDRTLAEWIEIEVAMRPRLSPERRRRVVGILAEAYAR